MFSKKSALRRVAWITALLVAASLSGCLTSRKIDKFVAKEYGNRLPPLSRQKNKDIHITSAIPANAGQISHTIAKTSQMLPLLFYWQWDYKMTCTLNPAIPIHYFTNTVFSRARRDLNQKLDGRRLELHIEQLPNIFSWDDKAHFVWVILYGFGWDKVSIQPGVKDMIVSYKLLQNDQVLKSGEITIPDNEGNRRVRMFQSWKNATAGYIAQYNHDIPEMTRLLVRKLAKEL